MVATTQFGLQEVASDEGILPYREGQTGLMVVSSLRFTSI
jgi:hypothetical protein